MVAMGPRLLAVGAFVGALLGAGTAARAQGPTAAPPSPAPALAEVPAPMAPSASTVAPTPTAAPEDETVWRQGYAKARERLIAGDFAAAEAMFHDLGGRTSHEWARALATQHELLAREWARRDLVLVRRADLGESAISAKAAGQRTTDEISVLYTNAVLYGIGTGGWLAVQTEPESAAAGILPALGLAGAAVGGVALADHGKPLGYGVPQSMVSGMYIGLEEGLAWTFWNQARARHVDEWHAKTAATVIWGMTTAGAVAGGVVGTVQGTTPGRASFVGSAALWSGTIAGLAVGALSPDDDALDDRALLAAAVSVNVGAVAGAVAAGPVSPSIARVRFLDLGGIGGSILVGGLYLAAADRQSDGRAFMGAVSLGMAGGLATAWVATSGMPADRTEPPAASRPAAATLSPTIIPVAGGALVGLAGHL
jgi:hypothetical protein